MSVSLGLTALYFNASQGFLAKWLCTSSVISYTDLGRAYNTFSPSTGTTMHTALLSVIYGNLVKGNTTLKAQVRTLAVLSFWHIMQMLPCFWTCRLQHWLCGLQPLGVLAFAPMLFC
jgi:hypothetical protein